MVISATTIDHMQVVAVANTELPPSHVLRRSAEIYNYTLHLLLINASNANETASPRTQKPAKLLQFLRAQRGRDVVMLVDAYDVFFNQPSAVALRRFREYGSQIVLSAELPFSDQSNSTKPFYDALADAAPGAPHKHRYLNAGGVIGYAHALLRFTSAALDAIPQRSRLCGQPHGRRCSDQWLYGWVLSQTWETWNASLDYRGRLFVTAAGAGWSLSAAKARIRATRSCVVHMPYQVPMVAETWRALTDELVHHRPWPEAELSVCRERTNLCGRAKKALSHLFFAVEHLMRQAHPTLHLAMDSGGGAAPTAPTASACLPFVDCRSVRKQGAEQLWPDPASRLYRVCVPLDGTNPCVNAGHAQRTGSGGSKSGARSTIVRRTADHSTGLAGSVTSNTEPNGVRVEEACKSSREYPGSLHELCVHNVSEAFWKAMARALDAQRRPRNISKLSNRGLHIEAYRLLAKSRRYYNASRAFWQPLLGHCSAEYHDSVGKGRVWC